MDQQPSSHWPSRSVSSICVSAVGARLAEIMASEIRMYTHAHNRAQQSRRAGRTHAIR